MAVLLSGLVGHLAPLLFAFSAEAVYLGIAPGLPFIKKQAAQELGQVKEQKYNLKLQELSKNLKPDSLMRCQNLDKIRIQIQKSGSLDSSEKVNEVFLSYLKFLALKDQYHEYAPDPEIQKVQKEIQDLLNEEKKTEQIDEKQGIQKNVEILKKRQEHLLNIQALAKKMEIKLSEIENTLQLVLDQTLETKAGMDVSKSLNTLLAEVEATEEITRGTGGILSNLNS